MVGSAKITFDTSGLEQMVKDLENIGKTAREFLDKAEGKPEITISYVKNLLNILSKKYNDAGFAPTSRKIDDALCILFPIQNLPDETPAGRPCSEPSFQFGNGPRSDKELLKSDMPDAVSQSLNIIIQEQKAEEYMKEIYGNPPKYSTCKCIQEPRGRNHMEGFQLNDTYLFEKLEKENYYRVYPTRGSTYYETCGPNIFRKYFVEVDSEVISEF